MGTDQCEACGASVSSYPNGCPGCGAPQCCQPCCDKENLEARIRKMESDNLFKRAESRLNDCNRQSPVPHEEWQYHRDVMKAADEIGDLKSQLAEAEGRVEELEAEKESDELSSAHDAQVARRLEVERDEVLARIRELEAEKAHPLLIASIGEAGETKIEPLPESVAGAYAARLREVLIDAPLSTQGGKPYGPWSKRVVELRDLDVPRAVREAQAKDKVVETISSVAYKWRDEIRAAIGGHNWDDVEDRLDELERIQKEGDQ